MKFLLLIPVFALFLSNVPFEMEMKMPEENNRESCSMQVQEEMQCVPEETSTDEGCCKKESTCVCFYCFQLLAPTQTLTKYRFQVTQEKNLNGFYLQSHWSNPFIDGPLQPPDTV